MLHSELNGPLVVGTKQTLKALEEDSVSQLYMALDADEEILTNILALAELNKVPITYYKSMAELGQACSIQVGTATAALIKQDNGGEN